MNKAAFLDRDGTINIDYGYVCKYEDFTFIEGAIEALRHLQELGYLLIIVTNQSGIARGYCTEEDVQLLHKKMCDRLEKEGVHITGIYYCPHLGDACDCRKPKLGLFYQAAREYDIDMKGSIASGDKMRDLMLCEKEPVRGFWITESEEHIVDDKIVKVRNIREVISYVKGKI